MPERLTILREKTVKTNYRKLDRSNMMSEIGSLLVLAFVVAILLLYIDYSRIITMKIDLDNLNKNMLLIAEMYGGLSEEDMNSFYNNLANLGISKTDIVDGNFPTMEDKGQIAYGENIVISYTVNIISPIYKRFFKKTLFGSNTISPTIPIHIYGETVSKW